MAALRAAILLGGFGAASVASDEGLRSTLFQLFVGFGAYSIALYAIAFRRLSRGTGKAFYAFAGALDLAFAVLVVWQTGGVASPFFRALYLWVAICALLFGVRVGTACALIVFGVVLGFDVAAGWPRDYVAILLQAAGLMLHGTLVGYLADRERARVGLLSEARDRLTKANELLVIEQRKLVQAEKLSSIGMLASGVAHEVNNPLMGIMGCIKALQDESVSAERRKDYFDAVQDGLERIKNTVQSLLDYSRQRPPAPVDTDAAEVVESVMRLLQPLIRKKDVNIENKIQPAAVFIYADRTQIMQALVNIVMNALHAVKEGGQITFETEVHESKPFVGIRVEDNGVGMSKEVLAKACDPFFTTKNEGEGTGLGMAITLSIAYGHGGDLTIDSEVGVGTVVTLWLPVIGEKKQEEAAHA